MTLASPQMLPVTQISPSHAQRQPALSLGILKGEKALSSFEQTLSLYQPLAPQFPALTSGMHTALMFTECLLCARSRSWCCGHSLGTRRPRGRKHIPACASPARPNQAGGQALLQPVLHAGPRSSLRRRRGGTRAVPFYRGGTRLSAVSQSQEGSCMMPLL